MSRIALISGGSGGIGRATADLLVQNGWTVYELSRSGKSENGIIHISADVTDPESVSAAIRSVDHIDLLVCNAGMGISGAIEYTELDSAKKLFDVNFFGTFLLIRTALPLLRKSSAPRIIAVSSVAASVPIPFQAFYSASKAAVNSLVLCLRNELHPFGIRVSAVLPGDTSTGFTAAREKSFEGEHLYGNAISRAVSSMEKDEKNGMPPSKIASLILSVANKKHPKAFYTVGIKFRSALLLMKVLPVTLANRIIGMIYG